MHQAGRSLSGAITVLSDKAQPPAARHIRVECYDRNALLIQFVNTLAQFRRIVWRDCKPLNALRSQLFDAFKQPVSYTHLDSLSNAFRVA